MQNRPRSSSFSTFELIVILSVGLLLGGALAGLVLVEAWLLVPRATPVAVAPTTAPPAVTVIPAAAAFPGGVLRTDASPARLELPSGALIILAPDSELTLSALPAPDAAERATWLTLERGRVLVSVTLGAGEAVFIAAPTGLVAQVPGSLMGTTFDPSAGRFGVDCLEGHCQFGDDPDHTGDLNNPTDLEGGQSGSSDGGVSSECHNDDWRDIAGDLVPPCEGAPTDTPDRKSVV